MWPEICNSRNLPEVALWRALEQRFVAVVVGRRRLDAGPFVSFANGVATSNLSFPKACKRHIIAIL
jgi:hypothetical protein